MVLQQDVRGTGMPGTLIEGLPAAHVASMYTIQT